MRSLRVDLGERTYPIFIGTGIHAKLGEMLALYKVGQRFAVITNIVVDRIYGERVMASFGPSNLAAEKFVVADGERSKTLKMLEDIVGEMLERRCDRDTVIVALGGGVVIDLAGFVAATFMRGVDFVAVPTTLLAQADASIGGKVGVNHPLGKNMIGAFHQPRMVWLDLDALRTLPQREVLCGLAEMIKHAMVFDRSYFEMIELGLAPLLGLQAEALGDAVFRSCQIKARLVGRDEQEHGQRGILNFGHTVGHAFEAVASYRQMRHGEAVLTGMLAEAYLAWKSGILNEPEFHRFERLLARIPLKTKFDGIDTNEVVTRLAYDKKARAGRLKMALPVSIGECKVTENFDAGQVAPAIEYGLKFFAKYRS